MFFSQFLLFSSSLLFFRLFPIHFLNINSLFILGLGFIWAWAIGLESWASSIGLDFNTNDVKNYWNTHLQKKLVPPMEELKPKTQKTIQPIPIRLQPRTFSKNLPWLTGKTFIQDNTQPTDDNHPKPSPAPPPPPEDNEISLWDNMLVGPEIENGSTWSIDGHYWDEKVTSSIVGGCGENYVQEDPREWSDMFIDNMNIWEILGMDKQ